jgi:hypothetical protein
VLSYIAVKLNTPGYTIFVAYLVFISSIRVDPGPTNRGPTSLLALKIRTPVANTGKIRSIGQVPVAYTIEQIWFTECIYLADYFKLRKKKEKTE